MNNLFTGKHFLGLGMIGCSFVVGKIALTQSSNKKKSLFPTDKPYTMIINKQNLSYLNSFIDRKDLNNIYYVELNGLDGHIKIPLIENKSFIKVSVNGGSVLNIPPMTINSFSLNDSKTLPDIYNVTGAKHQIYVKNIDLTNIKKDSEYDASMYTETERNLETSETVKLGNVFGYVNIQTNKSDMSEDDIIYILKNINCKGIRIANLDESKIKNAIAKHNIEVNKENELMKSYYDKLTSDDIRAKEEKFKEDARRRIISMNFSKYAQGIPIDELKNFDNDFGRDLNKREEMSKYVYDKQYNSKIYSYSQTGYMHRT